MNNGTWLAFLLASLVLAATPGPGVVYIVTRTLGQGRAAGLVSVAAVAVGNLGNALAAAFGLAALLALSSVAFAIVKFAGAGYLIYLGVRALRRAPRADGAVPIPVTPLARIFRDGAVVALLNPKTTLFFAAFLPQFIDTSSGAAAQSAMLGAVFVLIATVTDSAYVLAAHVAAASFGRHPRAAVLGRYATATTYIGLGLLAATSGTRPAR